MNSLRTAPPLVRSATGCWATPYTNCRTTLPFRSSCTRRPNASNWKVSVRLAIRGSRPRSS
jgi:hypothetical protein